MNLVQGLTVSVRDRIQTRVCLPLKHILLIITYYMAAIKYINAPWKKNDKPRQCIKKQRHHIADKCPYIQSYGFSTASPVMYGCESWTIKKDERRRIDAFKLWCWRRLLRVPWTARRSNHSILKEINPEYSLFELVLKFPILRPPDAKSWLIGKDPDVGKHWRQEEKGVTEDEMVGWQYWLKGHEFEQTLRDSEGQGSSSWGRKESDTTVTEQQHISLWSLKHFVTVLFFPNKTHFKSSIKMIPLYHFSPKFLFNLKTIKALTVIPSDLFLDKVHLNICVLMLENFRTNSPVEHIKAEQNT